MREGWLGTEKYKDPRPELQQKPDTLWAELNESDHDRLLYAMSKPNGAAVESVIGELAAGRVGLQAGGCRSGQFCDRTAQEVSPVISYLSKSDVMVASSTCRLNVVF